MEEKGEEGGDEKSGGIRTEKWGTLLNVIVLTGIGIMKCKKEKLAAQAKKSAIGNILDKKEEGGVGDVEQQKNKENAG